MLTGDIDLAMRKLGKLSQLVDDLTQVPRKVARIAAPRISRLLTRQFSQGVDPYGRRWKRLASGKAAHLKGKTLDLSDGTKAVALPGRGIAVTLGAWYGFFHQVGTRNMPARRILPQRGMPAEWTKVLDTSAREAFRQAKARAS